MERLEADATRARRDILVAANAVLRARAPDARALDPRETATVAALADITARLPSAADADADDADADAGAGWSAASDASTRAEDVALASASAALRDAHAETSRCLSVASRLDAFVAAESRRDAALAAVAAGAFADAAHALVALRAALDALDASERTLEDAPASSAGIQPATPGSRLSRLSRWSARARALVEDAAAAETALETALLERLAAAFIVEEARVVVDPRAAREVWRGLPALRPESSSAASSSVGDDLAMEFFLPLVDAAADDGAAVRAHVEDDGEGRRVLTWTVVEGAEEGAEDAVVVPALAAALETAATFLGEDAGLRGDRDVARQIAGPLWATIAAAVQSRWFADESADEGADEGADGGAAGLDDAAVDALIAAEATAAAMGFSPAPPAVGPMEAAAFERERRLDAATRARVLSRAREIVLEGERDRATIRVGPWTPGEGFGDELGSADDPRWTRSQSQSQSQSQSHADASSASSAQPCSTSALSVPPCTVSLAAHRLAEHASRSLADAAATATTTTASVASGSAARAARATAAAAADCLDLFRAMLPALRSPGDDPSDAIVAGGPAAAVVFRNDAHYLATRWLAAAYVHERGENANDDKNDDENDDKNENARVRFGRATLWVAAPLAAAGDAALARLSAAVLRDMDDALDDARGFSNLGDRARASESSRAVRRARHALGRAACASMRCLPAPLGVDFAASLASAFARRVASEALALADVSVDESEALRAIIAEAFATEGLLPPRPARGDVIPGDGNGDGDGDGDVPGDSVSVPVPGEDARRRRAEADAEAAAMVAAIPGCEWLKGAELASLLDAKLTDIADAWTSGRLPALGFDADEVAGFVRAVFEDTENRRRALADVVGVGV